MGLPTYNVGTASVANGNQSVTFAGGAALTSVDPTTGATLAVCGPGDVLVVAGSGGAFGVIQTVVDATHVTLETPWGGSTNATATYKIYRQSVPLTGSAAALAQTVLNQGSDSQPDLSRTIDNGVARVKLRIGTDGKAKVSTGTTGAPDASLLDGISIDPTTGAVSFPNGMKEYVLGQHNRLTNGGMRIWQENTTFTIASGSSAYVADQWFINNQLGVTVTVTKIAAPSGFLLRDALNIVATGAVAGGFVDVVQRLEGEAGFDIDAVACTYAFDLNATTTAGNLTGGVIVSLNTALDNGTFSATAGSLPFVMPTGSKRTIVTVPGANMSGAKNGTEVRTRFQQNAATSNINISLGAAQFEKGTVANDFEYRSFSTELAMCQRFMCKSYNIGSPVGSAVGNGSCILTFNTAAGAVTANIGFPTRMRTSPTMTLYDGAGNAGKYSYYNGSWNGNGSAIAALSGFEEGLYLQVNDASSVAQINFHWVARARL